MDIFPVLMWITLIQDWLSQRVRPTPPDTPIHEKIHLVAGTGVRLDGEPIANLAYHYYCCLLDKPEEGNVLLLDPLINLGLVTEEFHDNSHCHEFLIWVGGKNFFFPRSGRQVPFEVFCQPGILATKYIYCEGSRVWDRC